MATHKRQLWKTILTLITITVLLGMGYAARQQIAATLGNIGKVNTWALLLMIPVQMLNYHAQANLYKGLFRVLGEEIRYRFLYPLALELNFVNNVFPSAGVSGFSYLSVRMRSKNISTAKSTLVQMMRFILLFISFQILLFIGLVMLAIGGKASDLMILFAGSLATLLMVGTLIIGYVIGSKSRINSFFTAITRLVNRLIHIVRPQNPETINIERARATFTELHENYMHLKNNLGALREPLIYSLIANLTEVLAIYTVYIAFGHVVNPGAVIIAYAVANFAGLVSVLPGGVGIYEALMTAVLAAGGIPAGVSLPVTVMYRVINMLIQLPPGYLLYQRAIHAGPARDGRGL